MWCFNHEDMGGTPSHSRDVTDAVSYLHPGAAAAIASGNAAQRRTDRLPVTAVAIKRNFSPLSHSATRMPDVACSIPDQSLAGAIVKLPNYGIAHIGGWRSRRRAQALERAVIRPMLHPAIRVAAACRYSVASSARVRQIQPSSSISPCLG